jgi:hypothetical protein
MSQYRTHGKWRPLCQNCDLCRIHPLSQFPLKRKLDPATRRVFFYLTWHPIAAAESRGLAEK